MLIHCCFGGYLGRNNNRYSTVLSDTEHPQRFQNVCVCPWGGTILNRSDRAINGENLCRASQIVQMLSIFILSLLLFLIVTVVVIPGLTPTTSQSSSSVVEEVVSYAGGPSFLTCVAALFLLLVCIHGDPLHWRT